MTSMFVYISRYTLQHPDKARHHTRLFGNNLELPRPISSTCTPLQSTGLLVDNDNFPDTISPGKYTGLSRTIQYSSTGSRGLHRFAIERALRAPSDIVSSYHPTRSSNGQGWEYSLLWFFVRGCKQGNSASRSR